MNWSLVFFGAAAQAIVTAIGIASHTLSGSATQQLLTGIIFLGVAHFLKRR